MAKTKDLTSGSPFKLIISFSFPVLLGFFFQELYHTADTIIVGRLLGSEALGAVGATSPLIFLVFGFIQGATSGFAVFTSQAFGAKDKQKLEQSVAANIILNVIMSAVITFISVVSVSSVLKLINTPDSIFEMSRDYLLIIYSCISFSVLYNATSCILRAVGNSKMPLIFLVISSVLNIILDYVFIKFFFWGVKGAAWATAIAQAVSGIISLIYIKSRVQVLHINKNSFHINSRILHNHAKIGIPMGFQFSITAIGSTILQSALNQFGAYTIAGFSAAQKTEHLVSVAANTMGVASANFTGQNFGARRLDRVKDGVKTCVLLSVFCAAISMFIALVFPAELTGLFVSQDVAGYSEVIYAAKTFLFWCSLAFFPLYLIFIFRNTLQALGHSLMPLMGGVTELLCRSLAAFTLPKLIGYTGICVAGSIAWVCASSLLIISYAVIIKKVKSEHQPAKSILK